MDALKLRNLMDNQWICRQLSEPWQKYIRDEWRPKAKMYLDMAYKIANQYDYFEARMEACKTCMALRKEQLRRSVSLAQRIQCRTSINSLMQQQDTEKSAYGLPGCSWCTALSKNLADWRINGCCANHGRDDGICGLFSYQYKRWAKDKKSDKRGLFDEPDFKFERMAAAKRKPLRHSKIKKCISTTGGEKCWAALQGFIGTKQLDTRLYQNVGNKVVVLEATL